MNMCYLCMCVDVYVLYRCWWIYLTPCFRARAFFVYLQVQIRIEMHTCKLSFQLHIDRDIFVISLLFWLTLLFITIFIIIIPDFIQR
jgi:hypothetical protein